MSVVRSRSSAAVACGDVIRIAGPDAIFVSERATPHQNSDQFHRETSLGSQRGLDSVTRIFGFFGRGAHSAAVPIKPLGGTSKRIFDVVLALAFLVLAAPLLLLVSAAVKVNMGGDVIYRHRRVGYGGQQFDCLKFRTMVANGDQVLERHLKENPQAAEEWRLNRKLAKDPRITRLGHILRKTSLDELPQLFNILLGDMSCVGPRPVVPDELKLYGARAGDYLQARPGITGPWQVSGRSSIGYAERVKLDSEYVNRWSLVTDLVILCRTVPAVCRVANAA